MRYGVFILSLLACPAAADVTSPSRKTVECYCTDTSGARIELGQSICLHVDGRMFTAQCQMSLNVPMWREVQNGCLSSMGPDVRPGLGQSRQQLPQSRIVDAKI
ncbi:hypothetical protein [Ascidiaceihabitans sp.]|uniref:hypothetical protein n=1 Tax=Ascidiaceihabitans sp. TaxID=1872644 RepID=UPI0032993710